ncbi:MAG: HAD-IC family P-type ATPase, partial [Oscillospiraceae bacterium]
MQSVDQKTTPLVRKMHQLNKQIFQGIMLLILFLIFFTTFRHGMEWSLLFSAMIALIVAMIPEGLPAVLTMILSMGVHEMARENAIIKGMPSVETLGSMTVICSDKTGTLTENRMTVTALYSGTSPLPVDEIGDGHIAQNFAVNSTATVEMADGRPDFIGNPTECALLMALVNSGVDYRARRAAAKVAYVYPFSSETKNMTTVLEVGKKFVAYTKGSPEKIMSFCQMPPERRAELEAAIEEFQKRACRVIGFAHRTLDEAPNFESEREFLEAQMEFDGFVAITDPLRGDVKDAVDRCRSAGIDLKILTGDNIVTASAIARDLGVLDEAHIAVEAREVEEISDEELAKILPKIRVIARSTPSVKMRVVNMLRSQGNVVAVTGDGINDAPALKNADVGVAMGITGTEVSKEASDIILLDDSFTTIVRAVEWGRGIFENFLRFIQFQLTVNVSSVVVVLACILTGAASPFTALELLWINLIMDGPPALTLGLEPMRKNLMRRKPTPRNAPLVSKRMLT